MDSYERYGACDNSQQTDDDSSRFVKALAVFGLGTVMLTGSADAQHSYSEQERYDERRSPDIVQTPDWAEPQPYDRGTYESTRRERKPPGCENRPPQAPDVPPCDTDPNEVPLGGEWLLGAAGVAYGIRRFYDDDREIGGA